jgi:hypothetical protein
VGRRSSKLGEGKWAGEEDNVMTRNNWKMEKEES